MQFWQLGRFVVHYSNYIRTKIPNSYRETVCVFKNQMCMCIGIGRTEIV